MNIIILKKYLLLLLIAVVLFAAFIYLEKYRVEYSYKLDDKKGLNQRSIHIMNSLRGDDAMKFSVYSNRNTAIAKKIKKFFRQFQRRNEHIQVEFIDPVTNPAKVKQNAITMQGEISLSYVDEKRLEHINITELSESVIINSVLRLKNMNDEWLIFAEGYGMRTIEDETARGLSQLLIHLKKMGVHIARMPLNPLVELPENVKVIVLPSPAEILDEKMVSWLQKQSNRGISLWWLNDIGNNDQTYLELALDIMFGSAVTIAEQGSTTLTTFPQHIITENFNQPIYLPEVRQVLASDAQALLKTPDNHILAVTKQLTSSRIVITGNSDFISNQYLNAAANRSFTTRIVDWLFYHDDRVNIPVQINKNTQLFLSTGQLLILSIFFLITLPVIFIIIAWKQWRIARV
ncbi:MAG: Gldg family protein [Alcanivoracaceae bacterium]|nr:Gldg family protein [Alcanivoracaceae bacterium]